MINFDLQVKEFPFNANSQTAIESWKDADCQYGNNWPVVYFIHDDDARVAYIGETLNAGVRAAQHWGNPERQQLKVIHLMTDKTFNKSVILDLESYLIRYVAADGKYKLQNGNSGQTDFNYFARMEYEREFGKVWEKLKELNLVQTDISEIENSDLYKYSPYKNLTEDQQKALKLLLYEINGFSEFGMEKTIIVNGSAGTGKTILAVYLIKLLSDINNGSYDIGESDTDKPEDGSKALLQNLISKKHPLRIGFVVPMQSLRETIRNVFKSVGGLSPDMIMSPGEVAKKGPFDILVVDESHRLQQRYGLQFYPIHDRVNQELGLPEDATELDWVLNQSKVQILFYDSMQSVRPADIPRERFNQIISGRSVIRQHLTSQLRCLGGDDYIKYVKQVLSGNATRPHGAFDNYDIRFFDDVDRMTEEINRKDREVGLSCTVAGYGWKWITKGEPENTKKRDITIGKGYIWNRTATDWINSKRLPDEVGCIHTVQGYDLNYVGVIFGPEIDYDPEEGVITVSKKVYQDQRGKLVGEDMDALKEYIINIYAVLMTRGIRGTYVYATNSNLREYLRRYFDCEDNIRYFPGGGEFNDLKAAQQDNIQYDPN